MSSYLLPCVCGQTTVVTPAQAGQSVRCGCGLPLEVPTLRGLQRLAPATSAADKKEASPWSNRHRIAFALIVVSLGCLGGAGFLVSRLPPAARVLTAAEIDSIFDASPPDQVMQIYQAMQSGLRVTSFESIVNEHRTRLLWIIAGALTGGCLTLIAAIGVLLSGRKTVR